MATVSIHDIAQGPSRACPVPPSRYARDRRRRDNAPRRIGSGPAGYYVAEACQKLFGPEGDGAVLVDVLDRLPVPHGLIRTGVAPDHQSIKAVTRRYEVTALSDNVRFVGNVAVGRDISIAELLDLYDAVVLATGAPADRPLGVPGDDLPSVGPA